MKKKIIIFSILSGMIALVFYYKHRSEATAEQAPAVWVGATTVQQSVLPMNVHAIGTVTARSVEVSPEVSGHVEKIFFTDGASVKKGQPLIQLDDALYKVKFDSAKAKFAYSENDYKRKDLLARQGVISQQALDQALADLKQAKASMKEAEVMLNTMQLLAPFDGMVGKSKVNPGDYVTTGQNIVSLTDTKNLRIEYNVPEVYLPLLKSGQVVTIKSSAYPDKSYHGKLMFVSPTINSDNRSVSLYAEIVNENNELTSGMFVNVKHALAKQEQVIMIPARSLMPVLDGAQVYKIVDGKALAINVTPGRRRNENIQITQGLMAGDKIITDGQQKVMNGMPVQIKS